jgi:hypothetical protein
MMKNTDETVLRQRAQEFGYELRTSYVLVDSKNMLIVAGEDTSLETIWYALDEIEFRRNTGEYRYLK